MNRFWATAVEIGRRLDGAQIPYCVIKSYGGNPTYNDSNVDIVVGQPLLEVHKNIFSTDFVVTHRDMIKHRIYERNKLMCNHVGGDNTSYAKLHLHRDVGWHNICFVPAPEIFRGTVDHMIEGGMVHIAERHLEARLFVLHIIFEQFRKNSWDTKLLKPKDFDDFAHEYALAERVIGPVRDALEGPLSLRALRPIWRRYYEQRASETPITTWNRFLHWGFTVLKCYRAVKKRQRRH